MNTIMLSDTCHSVNGLYTLGKTIGTGHFAVVKLARHVFTQKEVAVKVIDKHKLDDISKAHLFQEVMCMKLVQHPNVVRLYEVIDTPSKLYLILELGDGGDMYDYITKHVNGLNESLARRYFWQICRALKYCHEMQVCHRDLKPENLVFFEKQGVVKLTDFGFSNQFTPGKKLLTSCGSLAYSAPEILLGDPYDAAAVDIWSLGVILFMLVTGRAPFQEANDSETVMMILDCSYKLPSTVSTECQHLIHRMIVRESEKRATLDEVMSDLWLHLHTSDEDGDDEDDDEQNEIESSRFISEDEHQSILQQMITGNIADKDTILQALNEGRYNYITATYYLLAENLAQYKIVNRERNVKRQRRTCQPINVLTNEQIGVYISPSSNTGKENTAPLVITPRHSIDSTNDLPFSALIEDDEERPTVQQRTPSANIPTTPAQTMRMILEEDENPEPSPTDKSDMTKHQITNIPKLRKIVESGDEDNQSSISTTTVRVENPTTTSGILRSKDLRSVIETRRRNFSRSHSSSDSEDNSSLYEISRAPNRKQTRSPGSFQEIESATNSRGRSMSNIEHVLNDIPSSNTQQQIISTNSNDYLKRKSFSRASSTLSTNRLLLVNANDDNNSDTLATSSSIVTNDRSRSLSVDHRLTNHSQFSIASRISIRYSTPRESTVFTKTDAPMIVRLLQQSHHQDSNDAIKTIIEHQRSRSISLNQENQQTPVIIEEDITSPSSPIASTKSNRNSKSPIIKKISSGVTKSNIIAPTIERVNVGHAHDSSSSSQHSVLSTLKCSLIKHQQQRKTLVEDASNSRERKNKHSRSKHRACCTIA
ncbi:unnamed protein product [Adineta ricciae]|uniref:SNF-related serine/threonine-protein kinase n=1 Tax=Adineta ricciae TaxID=249248 RepID=A0A813VRG3_ADIRI|nr:unnamed protein product [Adineta ricciae]